MEGLNLFELVRRGLESKLLLLLLLLLYLNTLLLMAEEELLQRWSIVRV